MMKVKLTPQYNPNQVIKYTFGADSFVAEIGGILTGRSCAHGVMIRKEGVGKTGKPYKGWVCPDNNRTCATWE